MIRRGASVLIGNQTFRPLASKSLSTYSAVTNQFHRQFFSRSSSSSSSSLYCLYIALMTLSVGVATATATINEQAFCAADGEKKSHPPSPLLEGDEFRKAIVAKVDVARKELASKVKKLPIMKIHVPEPDDRVNTYGVTIELERGHDVIGLMAEWSRIVKSGTDGAAMKPVITERNKELNIISADKASSVQAISEQINKSSKRNYSVRAYKDGGFSVDDIYYIVEGFKNAALGSLGYDDGSVRVTTRRGSSMDDLFGSFNDIAGSDSLKRGGRSSSSSSSPPEQTGNPVEKLQQLGVEVYAKEDNAKLDWDSLAGYDYVKKFLEETIINSIKFPEIYDNITKNTRVNYESNRPKAVLLEGPPGTGWVKHSLILSLYVLIFFI